MNQRDRADESSHASHAAVVVMGVAGSGKTSLGLALAQRMNWKLAEGDDFHSAENKARMHAGVPLTDADREGWLRALGDAIQHRETSLIVTCSALKRSYRDLLRAASPGLRFLFLDVPQSEAWQRVAARGETHFFPPNLLQNQFDTLEPPSSEPNVLRLDATLPVDQLVDQSQHWLAREEENA